MPITVPAGVCHVKGGSENDRPDDENPALERVATALAMLPQIRKLLDGFRKEAEARGLLKQLADWPYNRAPRGASEEDP
jgi:hypothetical protein